MYLMLKELANIADDVIIVISSLTKDINSKIELYHANAIRVLCKIADVCPPFSSYSSLPSLAYLPSPLLPFTPAFPLPPSNCTVVSFNFELS